MGFGGKLRTPGGEGRIVSGGEAGHGAAGSGAAPLREERAPWAVAAPGPRGNALFRAPRETRGREKTLRVWDEYLSRF